jgi:hypothetical protein
LLEFREYMDSTSAQLQSEIDKKLEDFKLKQNALEDEQQRQKCENKSAVKNLMSEVLWRIKDAEELIKSRVSEVRVFAMINELKTEVKCSVSHGINDNRSLIDDELAKINSKIAKEFEKTSTSFSDIKTVVQKQDKKINELATREQIKTLENSDK